MEAFFVPISAVYLEWLEKFIDDWFFVFALAFLAFEFVRYAIYKKLSWAMVGDTITNYITLTFFIGLTILFLGAFYVSTFYYLLCVSVCNFRYRNKLDNHSHLCGSGRSRLLLGTPVYASCEFCMGDPHGSPLIAVFQYLCGLSFRALGFLLASLFPPAVGDIGVQPNCGPIRRSNRSGVPNCIAH